MKKFLALTLALAFSATVATASDLNITLQSGGLSTVTVGPGDPVSYSVVGELTDAMNGGLALWACDIAFTGGPLAPGTEGAGMGEFVRPLGITNPGPGGFGGTTTVGGREGELVQAGGGMNTILNFVDNASFPIGVVTELIAQPGSPEVLMTGSLTAPMAPGTYTLTASNCFGNVIKDGETGLPFWATMPFGIGAVTNLEITVESTQLANLDFIALSATEYPCDTSLSREGNNILRFEFSIPVSAPGPGDIEIRELLDGGAFGPDIAAQLVITVENDNVLTITEPGQVFTNGKWYGVTNSGLWTEAAPFQVDYAVVYGDANGTFSTSFTDLSAIRASFADPGNFPDNSRNDINTAGGISFTDLSAARADFTKTAVLKPTGHGCSK